MRYLLIGVCGFLIGYLLDYPPVRKVRFLRITLECLSFGLLSAAVVGAAIAPQKFQVPQALSSISWILLAIFLLLFIYSQFIEIPFRQAYLGTKNDRLVKTGTYALTRHPGVIWAALGLLFLTLATRSKVLILAAPIWMIMDFAWVWIQDTFHFPKFFAGYNDYKKEVPMLLPTRRSHTNP